MSPNAGVLYSVDDAVSKAGYGKFQIKLTILAGLGWLADAFEIFILSIIGDLMACEWNLYRWHIALLTSVVFTGIMLGSPVLGIIADIYGRKKCLGLSSIMIFILGVSSAASPSYTWMVVLRALVGFALGGVGQGLTLYSEYCPANVRGRVAFFLCYFWSVGTVGVILLAWVVMEYLDNWRILLGCAAIPSLIVIIAIKWYPESARYFLVSNKPEEADKILKKMADMNNVSLPDGQLAYFCYGKSRGRIGDLFRKEYKRTTLFFCYIWFAVGFAYFGVALLSPILIQKGSFMKISESNSTHTTYYEDMMTAVPCSKYTRQNYIDLLWTSSAELPGLVVYTFLVECLSRKTLLSGSCIISSILMLLLLLKTQKTLILIILFGVRAILVSIFQLNYIMTSEAFPTTVRALAIGTGTAFCRLGGLIVPFIAQVLIVESPIIAMCLMAGILFISGIAAAFLPFETRNSQMKESHEES
ncbi:synaptic vesicle 2-related protein isoform X2 [Parasteatoda tepidariorum]|uniref:synaptic vesicle 2-related protein isoform X2 n=1 Tax=Parasteatoda tepidariorum TaxID=114398 RepID=UPI0039BCAC30